jgi:aspartate/tyrosine/aromatic aminotransferase
VVKRILAMRFILKNELERIGVPGAWNHITEQKGMFSYTGLSEKVCDMLINNYHIYMSKTGRISISGITTKNVSYLASSIKKSIQ